MNTQKEEIRNWEYSCVYMLHVSEWNGGHACDVNILEKEAEGSQVLGQSETHSELLATPNYSENCKNGSFPA